MPNENILKEYKVKERIRRHVTRYRNFTLKINNYIYTIEQEDAYQELIKNTSPEALINISKDLFILEHSRRNSRDYISKILIATIKIKIDNLNGI